MSWRWFRILNERDGPRRSCRRKTDSWWLSVKSHVSRRESAQWHSWAVSARASSFYSRWVRAVHIPIRYNNVRKSNSDFSLLFCSSNFSQQLNAILTASMSIKSSSKLKKILEVKKSYIPEVSDVTWLTFQSILTKTKHLFFRSFLRLGITWTVRKEAQHMDFDSKVLTWYLILIMH